MITPEMLISQLQDRVSELTAELDRAQQDIKDFEILAIEWKKGYSELNIKHRIEIGNLKQTIEQLEQDLADAQGF